MFSCNLSRISKVQLAALLVIAALAGSLFALMRDRSDGVGILTAAAAIDTSGQLQYNMFLKLDGIPGESPDSKHKNEIAVDSFSWSADRAPGGKPGFNAMTVTMPVGKASPKMFLHTAGGLKITRSVLSVRRAGSSDDFLKWILTDSLITSYKTVGNTHGDGVMDQVTLVPGKIEVELKPADGSATAKAGWDLRTGKSVSN